MDIVAAGNSRSSDKVEIPPDAFVRRTKQLWKLVVGGLVLPLPVAWWGWECLRGIRLEQPATEAGVSIAILLAGAIAIVALLASVRCPRCHASLTVRVMRAPEGLDAITSFLKTRVCPSCGYDPAGRPSRIQPER
jgi:hypothetical protein